MFARSLIESVFGDDVFWNDEVDRKRQQLIGMGDRAVDPLRELLLSGAPDLVPEGLIRALGDIGTERAIEALGRLLALPDDNTTNTLRIYESAAEVLVKADSDAARRELERARSGPAAAYVDAIIRLAEEA